MKKLKQILEEETGLGNDEFFAEPDELEEEEEEVEEFDEDTEDEILEEMLGLDSDFTLEDFLDSWDP